jgi:hypothetical protein
MALSQRSLTFGTLGLIAIHLAVVLPFAYLLNIWSDEASTLYATQNGLWRAFESAAIEQKQAPLYFWVLALWRQVNDSIFFARLFSVICSVAAIWIFSRIGSRLLSAKAALPATAFFALHPYLMWASLETRVYSLVILVSLGLIYLFLKAFWLDEGSVVPARIGFVLLAIASLYTNYYLGFLLVGLFVPLLVVRPGRSAAIYVSLMMIVGLVFLPMIMLVRAELGARDTAFIEDRTLITGIKIIWYHVLTFILPADATLDGTTPVMSLIRLWIVRLMLLVIGVLTFFRWRQLSRFTLAMAGIVGTLCVLLIVAYFLVGSWMVEIRHAAVLFGPVILFFASLIYDIFGAEKPVKPVPRRIAIPAFATIVIAFFGYSFATMYPALAKAGDWEQVGSYLEKHERPHQPIIVFHTYDALAVPYYYKGVNRVLPDERYFEFDFGSVSDERTEKRTAFTISKIPGDANELWLIQSDECDKTPEVCEPFDRFVNERYDRVERHEFYQNRVFLLRRKSTAD